MPKMGVPHILPDFIPDLVEEPADATLLIRIHDLNLRRLSIAPAFWLEGEVAADDGSVVGAPAAPPGDPTTRLDLHLSHGDPQRPKRLLFHLIGDGLRFMADPRLAVSGGEPAAQQILYAPIRHSDRLASVTVRGGQAIDTSYSLGIEVEDEEDPRLVTPVFVDPKVRNDG